MVYFSVIDLGSGSDYAGFIGIAGVPSLDVRYTHNFSIIDYPLYHSVYETFHLVQNHLDNNFKASHVKVTQGIYTHRLIGAIFAVYQY